MSATLVVGGAGILAAFHGWLLWARLASGGVFEPLTAARWTVALLVVAALIALRRLGVSLVWSRQAAVVWLLVVLIHVGAFPPIPGASPARGADPGLLFAIPTASAVVFSLVTVAAAARWRRRAARQQAAARAAFRPVWLLQPAPVMAGFVTCEAPRPPPL